MSQGVTPTDDDLGCETLYGVSSSLRVEKLDGGSTTHECPSLVSCNLVVSDQLLDAMTTNPFLSFFR